MNRKETNKLEELPELISIIPMRICPVFPGLLTTIEITDPHDIDTVKYASEETVIGVLLLKDSEKNLQI